MKNTIRVRKNGATKPVASQSKICRSKKPEAGIQTAGDIAAEALAAIDELKYCGSAIIALAVMNANDIRQSTDGYSGWDDLEIESFQAGNLALPRILADEFKRELSIWRDDISGMLHSSGETHPYRNNVDNAVNALVHLVDLQGSEISNRNQNCSFAASFIVTDRLKEVFEQALNAARKLYFRVNAKTAAPSRQEVAS